MIFEVTMPVLGLTMERGTIVAWLKQVGDRVEAGEPLFMVETDKATSDAPSPASGTLARIVNDEGDTVTVGAVIAYLTDTAADLRQVRASVDAAATNATEPAAAPAPAAAKALAGSERAPSTPAAEAPMMPAVGSLMGRVLASPRARVLAHELGIDLSAAPAVDRLTEKDVVAMVAAAARGAKPPKPPTAGAAALQPAPPPPAADPRIRPLSRTRRIIAERMTLSTTTIPQVTYTLRCDVTEALALRRSLKSGPGGERTAISLDALLVRAAALALAAFPEVNSQWMEGQGVRLLAEVNIAVAVDLDDRGLVIPVIHGADRLDIRATAAELERLVAGARAGKLGPDDHAGATFTITSLASLGVETFNPIIVPPQAAILGVGAIVPTPVFRQDQVVKRRLMALSLTTDHRILDGALSARFLSKIRDLLEQPGKLST